MPIELVDRTFHRSGTPVLRDTGIDGMPVALQIAAEATQLRRPGLLTAGAH